MKNSDNRAFVGAVYCQNVAKLLANTDIKIGKSAQNLPFGGHARSQNNFVEFILFESNREIMSQVRGLNWLISLYENGLNGILADEMVCGVLHY